MLKNEDIIEKMRREIPFKLRAVDSEIKKWKRIEIKKSVLERLLFDIDMSGEHMVKLPVWSGNFLEYIDLGAISFTEVLWDGEKLGKEIVYKNTNARINFSDASVIKYSEKLDKENHTILYSMRNCDFSGTDLSCNSMQKMHGISGCNLEYTKFGDSFQENDWLRFSSLLESGEIYSTSFAGLDFLNIKLPLLSAVRSECNFADSGVQFFSGNMQFSSEQEQKEFEQAFCHMLNFDKLRNCYVDQIGLILPESTLSETLKSVDEQILSFTKKDC